MFRTDGRSPSWLAVSVALVALSVGLARGQSCHPRATAPAFDQPRPQVMTSLLGFEDHQRGYLAKVQGASSQNVLWVVPSSWPAEEPRPLFRLFQRRR